MAQTWSTAAWARAGRLLLRRDLGERAGFVLPLFEVEAAWRSLPPAAHGADTVHGGLGARRSATFFAGRC